jgi:septal ring factor EnvC (AmiA/AmiB activator)
MQRAIKDIEKLGKGLGDDPGVLDILRHYNEDVNEGVSVDRRTLGFKDAMLRNEKAKKVRETAKMKREKKKEQDELDARYEYDAGVDDVMARASEAMGYEQREDAAANANAHSGVDMAPDAGKKKKDKFKVIKRPNY